MRELPPGVPSWSPRGAWKDRGESPDLPSFLSFVRDMGGSRGPSPRKLRILRGPCASFPATGTPPHSRRGRTLSMYALIPLPPQPPELGLPRQGRKTLLLQKQLGCASHPCSSGSSPDLAGPSWISPGTWDPSRLFPVPRSSPGPSAPSGHPYEDPFSFLSSQTPRLGAYSPDKTKNPQIIHPRSSPSLAAPWPWLSLCFPRGTECRGDTRRGRAALQAFPPIPGVPAL